MVRSDKNGNGVSFVCDSKVKKSFYFFTHERGILNIYMKCIICLFIGDNITLYYYYNVILAPGETTRMSSNVFFLKRYLLIYASHILGPSLPPLHDICKGKKTRLFCGFVK